MLVLVILSDDAAWTARQATAPYDLIIRRGTVYDGSAGPPFTADVGIIGDRIASLGDLRGQPAAREIDARGLAVAPGFIDMHSHADWAFNRPGPNVALNFLTQGIATVVVGQDGRSAWPARGGPAGAVRAWIDDGLTVNVVLLVGHGTVRQRVMGDRAGRAGADELRRMRALVREAMDAGARGISTGLSYHPGRYADLEELVAVVEAVAPYGGVHISHLRDQGDRLMESVAELVTVARRTGVTSVATHFKAVRRPNYGKADGALALIAAARTDGLRVYADQYPYTTSSSGIAVGFLPSHLRHRLAQVPSIRSAILSSDPGRLARLFRGTGLEPAVTAPGPAAAVQDPALRSAVRTRIDFMGGPGTYRIERAAESRLAGRTLTESARLLGLDIVEAATLLDLIGAVVTHFHIAETDLEAIMRDPGTATSSDGTIPLDAARPVHPRSYGSFPRKIRRYALDRGVLTLEAAIRSMTGLAADILRLRDRGYVREGYYADLVTLDLERLRDHATYADPRRHSEGVEHLVIGGAPVLERGAFTGAFPGRFIGREAAGVAPATRATRTR